MVASTPPTPAVTGRKQNGRPPRGRDGRPLIARSAKEVIRAYMSRFPGGTVWGTIRVRGRVRTLTQRPLSIRTGSRRSRSSMSMSRIWLTVACPEIWYGRRRRR